MADRNIHYEAAFEAFLRDRGIPCVAVDEAKKALFANAKLKSFDFVVYSKNGPNLLVDVKGRQLRNRSAVKGFETWATEQDVTDLMQWQQVFGEGYQGSADVRLLDRSAAESGGGDVCLSRPVVSADGDRSRGIPQRTCGGARRSGRRSALPAEDFRSLARPIESWL